MNYTINTTFNDLKADPLDNPETVLDFISVASELNTNVRKFLQMRADLLEIRNNLNDFISESEIVLSKINKLLDLK